MNSQPESNPGTHPRRRSSWARKLAWVAGIFVVLLVIGYLVVTSSAFFKGVIVPRVNTALNAEVTVEDASISPFSSVVLRGFALRTTGPEPAVTADEVRLRYSLGAIIGGNLRVGEVVLVSPKIFVEQNADGTSNLDPLMKPKPEAAPRPPQQPPPAPRDDQPAPAPAPGPKPGSTKPPQIDIGRVAIENGTVRVVQHGKDGSRTQLDLAKLNLDLTKIKNGETGHFTVSSDLAIDQQAPAPGTNLSMRAGIKGDLALGLTAALQPSEVKGGLELNVSQATGGAAHLAGVNTTLNCDVSPKEIRALLLRVLQGPELLAELRVSGPFDSATSEGTLRIELGSIDRRLLNLAGASAGVDFGPTTLSSSHVVTLSGGGKQVAAQGGLKLARLSITQAPGQTASPPTDIDFSYDTTADLDNRTAVLRALKLRGMQNDRPILQADLTSPMPLSWGGKADAMGDAALNLAVTNFNLADWKAFAAEQNPAGQLNATMRLLSQKAGKELGFDLAARIDGLAATVGTNRLSGLDVSFATSGHATNFNHVNLASTRLALAHQGQPAASLTASGKMVLDTKSVALDLGADAELARLLRIMPQPDLELTSGQLRLNTRVNQEGKAQTLTGTLSLTNLNGRSGQQTLKDFGLGTDFDLTATDGKVIDLRRMLVTLAETPRTRTNQVSLTGRMDLTRTNALEGTLQLTASTLDVTPYYDLVASQPASRPSPGPSPTPTPQPAPTPTPTPPPSSSTNAPAEPDPIQLPVRQLAIDARIGQFWLREIAATNVHASVLVEQSRVTIKPMELTMNGAPMAGAVDLDLSEPGWGYAVQFKADRLPLEPLANSFSPEYRGRAKGDVLVDIDFKGAGVTGASLRKNLAGKVGLSFTNADIQIVSSRLKGFLTPVAAAINAPGLLNSPLKWAAIDVGMGAGKLNFEQLALVSPAFTAATKGDVMIADTLSASRLQRWPMTFQLERSLAERVKLAPKDTPTNALFVAMPDFIKVAGTLDQPKPDLDLKALAGAALTKYVDKIPGVDEKTGNLLKGLGGILSGQKPAADTNSASSTNQTGVTNKPAKPSILDLLNRPKQ